MQRHIISLGDFQKGKQTIRLAAQHSELYNKCMEMELTFSELGSPIITYVVTDKKKVADQSKAYGNIVAAIEQYNKI